MESVTAYKYTIDLADNLNLYDYLNLFKEDPASGILMTNKIEGEMRVEIFARYPNLNFDYIGKNYAKIEKCNISQFYHDSGLESVIGKNTEIISDNRVSPLSKFNKR